MSASASSNSAALCHRALRSRVPGFVWPKCSLGSFRQNAARLALMLRSIAAEPERRRFHGPSPLRCVSKHEGVPVLILRDARTLTRLCGSACACALLRMRAAELAARRQTVFGNSHLTMSNSPSRSRGAFFCTRACNFASPTRIEGWAERRETFGCSAEHPLGLHMTRQARRLRGALRPMTRDARLSALHRGGFGLPGPRFSHRHLRRIGYSELLAPRS